MTANIETHDPSPATSAEVLMTGRQLSELLRRDFGISLAPATLKNLRWAAASDGPPFVKWRGRVYYPLAKCLDWVQSQRSPEVRSARHLENCAAASRDAA